MAQAPNKPVIQPVATKEPQLIDIVLKSLDDAKAEETVAIDISGKSSLSDHMVRKA